MRGLMKLAGVARFDCVGSTQEFTCYRAGLASPGDHTCGWTTSTLHSHRAWRYWFRWGCGASSTTSVIADLAGGHIPYPRSTGPDHAALHPLRRETPVTSRCTRSEGVQCLRIGCTASYNKCRCGDTSHLPAETRGNAVQRRLKRRVTTEKQAPVTRPLTAAPTSCLDTAPPEPFHTKPRKEQNDAFQPIIETSTIETYGRRKSAHKPSDYSAVQQRPKVTVFVRN